MGNILSATESSNLFHILTGQFGNIWTVSHEQLFVYETIWEGCQLGFNRTACLALGFIALWVNPRRYVVGIWNHQSYMLLNIWVSFKTLHFKQRFSMVAFSNWKIVFQQSLWRMTRLLIYDTPLNNLWTAVNMGDQSESICTLA